MASFDDLILTTQPIAVAPEEAVIGTDWEHLKGQFVDSAGTAIAWTSGYTGLCKIKDKAGGTTIATPTVSFPSAGYVKTTLANATTETIAPGEYQWEVEVTRTSDGKRVKLWGAEMSTYTVRNEVAD